jgi:argininosuccinate lyase
MRIDYEEIPHLPRLKRRSREYALVDLAHAVMLVETGIVSRERGARLLTGLLDILNRRRTAELLGHDGLVVNSADAGGFARDHLEEGVAVLALMMSDLGRLATDLFVWHTWEFGFVEVADALAGTSSIMPQKKNPHALERVKALAGQAIGWLPGMMGAQRTVLSTDLDFAFGDDPLTPAADACTAALRLMAGALTSLTVHRDAMAETAGAFWSTTSHLADELVRRFDLPFRMAHQIVATFVRDSLAAGHTPASVDPAMLARAAREAGVDVGLTVDELRRALDARHFVESRESEGSPNPRHVRAHAALVRAGVDTHTRWHAETSRRAARAVETLVERARELAQEAP